MMAARLEASLPLDENIVENHLYSLEKKIEPSDKRSFIEIFKAYTKKESRKVYKGREKLGDGNFIVGEGEGMVFSLKERRPEEEYCQLTLSIYRDLDSLLAEDVPSVRFFLLPDGQIIEKTNFNNEKKYGKDYANKINQIVQEVLSLEKEKTANA